jgi:hypothetical protein
MSKYTRPLRNRRKFRGDASKKAGEDVVEKNDEDILQAALAESQLLLRAEQEAQALQGQQQQQQQQEQKGDSKSGVKEVLYKDGATPLFKAIEECRWTEAFALLESRPDEVCTWVSSTGTENTTFGWSLWRRLPIHEVSFCYCTIFNRCIHSCNFLI